MLGILGTVIATAAIIVVVGFTTIFTIGVIKAIKRELNK